jgi:hypothetical protein
MPGAGNGTGLEHMSRKKDEDTFSMYVPQDEKDREMPDHLELEDTAGRGKAKDRLQGGAYNPYQKQDTGQPSDTARIRRPRVDLRKLSEWIKTTQKVKTLRDEDLGAAAKAGLKDDEDPDGK